MTEIMYKLLNIRFIKVLLYCDNDYVGKVITKDQGQEFIRHKRFGTYILPRTNIAYFRHGTEKRINYNVDFTQPLIPKYNKFDFFDKKDLNIRDLKRLKAELWDSIDKTTKLSPEYISELKERTYTESDIISLKYENNITPLELSHIISGEEIKLIMKNDKADWSWLLFPMLAFSVVIGLLVMMVGIPS